MKKLSIFYAFLMLVFHSYGQTENEIIQTIKKKLDVYYIPNALDSKVYRIENSASTASYFGGNAGTQSIDSLFKILFRKNVNQNIKSFQKNTYALLKNKPDNSIRFIVINDNGGVSDPAIQKYKLNYTIKDGEKIISPKVYKKGDIQTIVLGTRNPLSDGVISEAANTSSKSLLDFTECVSHPLQCAQDMVQDRLGEETVKPIFIFAIATGPDGNVIPVNTSFQHFVNELTKDGSNVTIMKKNGHPDSRPTSIEEPINSNPFIHTIYVDISQPVMGQLINGFASTLYTAPDKSQLAVYPMTGLVTNVAGSINGSTLRDRSSNPNKVIMLDGIPCQLLDKAMDYITYSLRPPSQIIQQTLTEKGQEIMQENIKGRIDDFLTSIESGISVAQLSQLSQVYQALHNITSPRTRESCGLILVHYTFEQ